MARSVVTWACAAGQSVDVAVDAGQTVRCAAHHTAVILAVARSVACVVGLTAVAAVTAVHPCQCLAPVVVYMLVDLLWLSKRPTTVAPILWLRSTATQVMSESTEWRSMESTEIT